MPTWAYIIVGLAVAVGPILTTLVLLRKAPAESRKISVDTVDVNVSIAGKLRDVAVRDWERIDAEMEDLRRDFNQYREDTDARLAEQAAEVRAARAGEAEAIRKAERYAEENNELRERVQSLEHEVASLKANGAGPHS